MVRKNSSRIHKMIASLKPNSGGAPCKSCSLPNRLEYDDACVEYAAMRGAEETLVSFTQFFREVLVRELKCPVRDWRAVKRHAENCLGLKISA